MRGLKKRVGLWAAIALPSALIVLGLLTKPLWLVDHNALWKIVHDQCLPNQASNGDPAPCVSVDLTERVAVLKDRNGRTQFLLIPTDQVTGIEAESIVSDRAPNYWAAAWAARRFVSQRAGKTLTDDQIALAINSQFARSQNQLHIHIDCIRQDVRDALRQLQPRIGRTWMHAQLLGQDYEMRLVSADDLKSKNLFSLVAEHLPPGQAMAVETIVLAGAALPDDTGGLDLLAGRYGIGGNNGNGEALQDHGCAVAKEL